MLITILLDIGTACLLTAFTLLFYYCLLKKAKVKYTLDRVLLEIGEDIISAYELDKYNLKLSILKILFNLSLIIIVFYEIINLKLYFTVCTTVFIILTGVVFKSVSKIGS